MKPVNVVNRFLIPLILLVGCRQISAFIYHSASSLPPGFLRTAIIGIFGPIAFISLWFFSFVGPPIAYYRGAKFFERLIIAFANPVIWIARVESEIACQFSGVEMIYFFFLPWTFGIMCVTCVAFSLSELVCRSIHKWRSMASVAVFHPSVIALLFGGLVGTYFGLIKGQEWVYMVVHHYAEHFLN